MSNALKEETIVRCHEWLMQHAIVREDGDILVPTTKRVARLLAESLGELLGSDEVLLEALDRLPVPLTMAVNGVANAFRGSTVHMHHPDGRHVVVEARPSVCMPRCTCKCGCCSGSVWGRVRHDLCRFACDEQRASDAWNDVDEDALIDESNSMGKPLSADDLAELERPIEQRPETPVVNVSEHARTVLRALNKCPTEEMKLSFLEGHITGLSTASAPTPREVARHLREHATDAVSFNAIQAELLGDAARLLEGLPPLTGSTSNG